MILTLHRPEGVITLDTLTATDQELLDIGFSQTQIDDLRHKDSLFTEFNDKLHQALLSYQQWDALTPPEMAVILKIILGYLLYKANLL